ncbi:FkbM family methyltransferase [Bradyrhizobium symbiodeficiens]|uniref:FkbM family methyltransferase n=1 Tax=Bradyrhizobium symbiodeficiens TaxID=1404367 RepID=UPI0030CAFD4C
MFKEPTSIPACLDKFLSVFKKFLTGSFRFCSDAVRIFSSPNPQISTADVLWSWSRFRLSKMAAGLSGGSTKRPYAFSVNGRRIEGPLLSDLWEMFHEIFIEQIYFATLPAGANIIDCGANVGCSAIYFKLSFPDARITCFEPNPLIFPYLQKNVSGLSSVETVQMACGKENGTISFKVHPAYSTGSTTKDLWSPDMEKIEVAQVRLSDRIKERVDLLKLDVEGAELDVLEDLEAAGKLSMIDRMSIEFHHNLTMDRSDLAQFLSIIERAGFAYTIDASRDATARFDNAQWQGMMIYAWRR